MESETIWQKMNSSKFLICAGAALASICESIASIAAGYPELAKLGFACTVIASACYAVTRTLTDCTAIRANANTTQTVKTVTATTSKAETLEKLAGLKDGSA